MESNGGGLFSELHLILEELSTGKFRPASLFYSQGGRKQCAQTHTHTRAIVKTVPNRQTHHWSETGSLLGKWKLLWTIFSKSLHRNFCGPLKQLEMAKLELTRKRFRWYQWPKGVFPPFILVWRWDSDGKTKCTVAWHRWTVPGNINSYFEKLWQNKM